MRIQSHSVSVDLQKLLCDFGHDWKGHTHCFVLLFPSTQLTPIEDTASLEFYSVSATPPKYSKDDAQPSDQPEDKYEGGLEEVDGKKPDEEGEDVSLPAEQEEILSIEETKNLIISFLFVIKYVEDGESLDQGNLYCMFLRFRIFIIYFSRKHLYYM